VQWKTNIYFLPWGRIRGGEFDNILHSIKTPKRILLERNSMVIGKDTYRRPIQKQQLPYSAAADPKKTVTNTYQQQQLKKLGIIIYYLDQFNHNRSLHTPRARCQTASQSEPLERATLLPGLSPRYVWLCSHTTVVF
jgi:hypothetical protein